jgi:DNA adenine methylase
MKPLLKWAGNKARLASQICAAFEEPCSGTYYEPFLGSAAVFLYRRSQGRVGRAVLSDVSSKLVEAHKAIRDDVFGVLAALAELPDADWQERYYDVRNDYNNGPAFGSAHAARLFWLNRAGYNGLYRENRKGQYNVPKGSYATLNLPDASAFTAISELLQGVEIVASSFGEVMSAAKAGDQVYCDPPYVPLSATASFTGYSKEPFGFAEQAELAEASRKAAYRGARVVLSNHDLPIVRTDLYPEALGFRHIARPKVMRAISRSADKRGAVEEVIAAIGPLHAVA